jgi:FxsC-like protein
MPCHFFFSYARADLETDQQVERFFTDLNKAVCARIAKPLEEGGFCDSKSIDHGQDWSDELARELHSCQVLVTLISPSYFTRPWCGKEWWVFQQRLKSYLVANPQAKPDLILPILWLPVATPPPVVARLQNSGDYGPLYASKGLSYLANLEEKEYKQILYKIADRIRDVAQACPLAPTPGLPAWSEARNAFQEAAPGQPAPPPRRPAARDVQFVYVVGKAGEMAGIRQDVLAYDPADCCWWKPFHPDEEDAILDFAQAAATNQKKQCLKLACDGNVVEEIKKAEAENRIVVVIVDPWSLKVANVSQLMSKFDEHRFYNCEVLLPWNDADPELTVPGADTREGDVRAVFYRQYDEMLSRRVQTPEALRQRLVQVMASAYRRIQNRAEATRTVLGKGPVQHLIPQVVAQG